MQIGEFKSLLAALALPPAGPLLLALLGLVLATTRRRFVGLFIGFIGLAMVWLLSCNAVAVWLAHGLLPDAPAVTAQQVRTANAQAVVVLGGGVLPRAPEYGDAQPASYTLARLRYGLWLARRTELPVAFSGGVGWSSAGMTTVPEAEVALRVAREEFASPLRWSEGGSRDTAENARLLGEVLRRDGIRRIALVTDAWHLPRAQQEFERAGFAVIPAPTGLAGPRERESLEWLPSAHGLTSSRQVLREWLALQAGRWPA